MAPSDQTNWWDQLDGAALEGGHGNADPASGFLAGDRVPTDN